ncbi:conserved hypothetical protein [Cupriavidus taiwanensis]|uniref:hypothetical protein n=1 Tax=Cupriavidus taiwanensis TaxID=164546 RepID=UPI000E189A0B|nr:hypothetical protein [Cupriavidus taiwanensis]SPA25878.1 conserved hypothetical protein [Cupriavidus taiwanensis]
MLVRAIQQGYAGKGGHQLREPGDVFEIEDEVAKVSLAKPGGTWFEAVEADKPGRGQGSKPKADDLA